MLSFLITNNRRIEMFVLMVSSNSIPFFCQTIKNHISMANNNISIFEPKNSSIIIYIYIYTYMCLLCIHLCNCNVSLIIINHQKFAFFSTTKLYLICSFNCLELFKFKFKFEFNLKLKLHSLH